MATAFFSSLKVPAFSFGGGATVGRFRFFFFISRSAVAVARRATVYLFRGGDLLNHPLNFRGVWVSSEGHVDITSSADLRFFFSCQFLADLLFNRLHHCLAMPLPPPGHIIRIGHWLALDMPTHHTYTTFIFFIPILTARTRRFSTCLWAIGVL